MQLTTDYRLMPWFLLRFQETESLLTQAYEAPVADYQVVEHFDVEQLASRDDLAGHQHILNTYMENHGTV